MKAVAICIDIAEFGANRILDPAWAARFPGAGWPAALAELLRARGIAMVTGDIAWSHVECGYWKAADIGIVQEIDSHFGGRLLAAGARGLALTGMESPLIAWDFYDRLPQIAPRFVSRHLFRGAFSLLAGNEGTNVPLRFPTYSRGAVPEPLPWSERKEIVLVAANKFWRAAGRFPLDKPWRWRRWTRERLAGRRSPGRTAAARHELQSKRYEAIEHFGSAGLLCLRGAGWHQEGRAPAAWRPRLREPLRRIAERFGPVAPVPVPDKVGLLRGFKFCLCIENNAYPGYVTEKIIDALVAGCVPVYWGAPDIADFVPSGAFVDVRRFGGWKELEEFLRGMSPDEATAILREGREFLASPEGDRHSFEGFAESLLAHFPS